MTNYNDFALTTNPEVNKNIVETFKHGVDALFAQYGMVTVMDICDLLGITSIDLEDSKFDDPMGEATGAAAIFGTTGGVMEAALRTVSEVLTGKELDKIDLQIRKKVIEWK